MFQNVTTLEQVKVIYLLKKNKVNVTIRRTQGDDIDAACGQLRAKERKEEVKGGIPDATSIFV